jgi:predicted nucleotidyltransferase
MRAEQRIPIDEAALAAFCQRNHIRWLAFFGSVLRPDFRSNSDIDILVDFEPGHVPGFAFVEIQDELSLLFGRGGDLHTPMSRGPDFRAVVVRESQVGYAASAPA